MLPAIRRHGFYSALEVQRAKQTELILAQCFPNLPAPAEPMFRQLIAGLLELRRESARGTPVWARVLASWIYGWALPVEGQQAFRRGKNPKRSAIAPDYSMLSPDAKKRVEDVIDTGCKFALIASDFRDWKVKMQIAYEKRPRQMTFMVPMTYQLPATAR